MSLGTEGADALEGTSRRSPRISRKPVGESLRSSAAQREGPHDSGHLAGTSQRDFEAQHRGEKTAQERTEEEIVMEYVKKQSMLERHHQTQCRWRATDLEERGEIQ